MSQIQFLKHSGYVPVIQLCQFLKNYIINQLLRKTFYESFEDFLKDLVTSCGLPENAGSPPIKFMDPVFGSKHPVYAHSGLPGFLCSFCFFFTILFTSGSLLVEKSVGLLERSRVAGLTYFEVVSAHTVVQLFLVIIQKTIMLLVFYVLFDHPLLGSPTLLVTLLFAIEIVGMAYGFFLSELFATDRLVVYSTIGVTMAIFCVGGVIWPMEGAHWLLRHIIWAFPVTPAVDSFESITLRGYGLSNYVVLRGFLSCFSWILLLLLATTFCYKRKRSKNPVLKLEGIRVEFLDMWIIRRYFDPHAVVTKLLSEPIVSKIN